MLFRSRRRPDGTTHWRALLDLVRHPYLRLLNPPDLPPGAARDLLRRMERRISQGTPYVRPRAVAEGAVLDLVEQVRADPASDPWETGVDGPAFPALSVALDGLTALADRLITAAVDAWAEADTPQRLADALAGLCNLLLDRDGSGDEKIGRASCRKRVF